MTPTNTDVQGSPAPTPGQGGTPANAYQLLFNKTYYASKPSGFQALYNGRPGSADPTAMSLTQAQVLTLINQLLAEGWVIDEQIDFLGWDAYSVMFMRELYGDTWVPAGMGNVSATTETPSQYTGSVPPGAIKVSTLLSDYPPYPVSAPGTVAAPPTALAPNPVGIRIIPQVPSAPNFVGDIFSCAVPNDGYASGSVWPATGTGTSGAFTGQWTKEGLELGMMVVWVKTA